MFALASHTLQNSMSEEYMEVARRITNTCHESYARSDTKLGPEAFRSVSHQTICCTLSLTSTLIRVLCILVSLKVRLYLAPAAATHTAVKCSHTALSTVYYMFDFRRWRTRRINSVINLHALWILCKKVFFVNWNQYYYFISLQQLYKSVHIGFSLLQSSDILATYKLRDVYLITSTYVLLSKYLQPTREWEIKYNTCSTHFLAFCRRRLVIRL